MDIKQIEETLKNHEVRLKKLEKESSIQSQPEHPNKKKEFSVKEFILEKKPRSVYHIGLVIAYYLEKYRDFPSFNIKDIEQGFREAKEPLPKNMSDLVYKNAKKGLMMEAKEQKEGKKGWILTNTGEKLVENSFQKINEK